MCEVPPCLRLKKVLLKWRFFNRQYRQFFTSEHLLSSPGHLIGSYLCLYFGGFREQVFWLLCYIIAAFAFGSLEPVAAQTSSPTPDSFVVQLTST